MKNSIGTTEAGRAIQPKRSQSLPKYACANFHASMLLIERRERYPNTELISFGG